MLKLSKRLLTLAEFVPVSLKAADIGTDHGFLPCYLVKKGISPFAVGIDVNTGPYQAACRTVRAYHMGNTVDIRQGDGMAPLRPGEVDVIIIAGMGGSMIREILTSSPAVVKRLQKVVLQPMNASNIVRTWLNSNEWVITEEDIVLEDGRFYEVIGAEPGPVRELSEAETYYGPLLIKNRHPLLLQLLKKEEKAMQEILNQLAKSKSDESRSRIKEFNEKLQVVKELKEWLFTATQ